VKFPYNDHSLKGGTPYANGGRKFPLPPPPLRDGSPARKESPHFQILRRVLILAHGHAVAACASVTITGPKFMRAACACSCSLLKCP